MERRDFLRGGAVTGAVAVAEQIGQKIGYDKEGYREKDVPSYAIELARSIWAEIRLAELMPQRADEISLWGEALLLGELGLTDENFDQFDEYEVKAACAVPAESSRLPFEDSAPGELDHFYQRHLMGIAWGALFASQGDKFDNLTDEEWGSISRATPLYYFAVDCPIEGKDYKITRYAIVAPLGIAFPTSTDKQSQQPGIQKVSLAKSPKNDPVIITLDSDGLPFVVAKAVREMETKKIPDHYQGFGKTKTFGKILAEEGVLNVKTCEPINPPEQTILSLKQIAQRVISA